MCILISFFVKFDYSLTHLFILSKQAESQCDRITHFSLLCFESTSGTKSQWDIMATSRGEWNTCGQFVSSLRWSSGTRCVRQMHSNSTERFREGSCDWRTIVVHHWWRLIVYGHWNTTFKLLLKSSCFLHIHWRGVRWDVVSSVFITAQLGIAPIILSSVLRQFVVNWRTTDV